MKRKWIIVLLYALLFRDMPKEEQCFFRALDDYQKGNSAGVVKKLTALNEKCRGSAEQCPIQLFLGVECYV